VSIRTPTLAKRRRGLRGWAKLFLKCAAIATALGIAGLTGFLILLSREHNTGITLPAPTGGFSVGRTTDVWIDDAQNDGVASVPGSKRTVFVWIWYPAASSVSAPPADYLPALWRSSFRSSASRSLPAVLLEDFFTRDAAVVHTHSFSDPPVSPSENSYPVAIMRAGGGALTTDFTILAEDLASHGYVVVGFDAPYRTGAVVFPDGRVVRRLPEYDLETLDDADAQRLAEKLVVMWSDDTRFVVDRLERLNAADPSGRFTGRLDLGRLGLFGHSLGGATSLQFCHEDLRCKAGIDIDGIPFGSVVAEGATQPFLFLTEGLNPSAPPGEEGKIFLARLRSIYERLPQGRLFLSVKGTNHFSFGDVILLKSDYIVRVLRLLTRGIEVRRGLAITTAYVHTFFDVHLKNAPPNLLDDLRRSYPEVQTIEQ
jgi:predicted dienelactone hydrolase